MGVQAWWLCLTASEGPFEVSAPNEYCKLQRSLRPDCNRESLPHGSQSYCRIQASLHGKFADNPEGMLVRPTFPQLSQPFPTPMLPHTYPYNKPTYFTLYPS